MNAQNHSFLRTVLVVDALVSGLTGLVMVVDAGALEAWLAVPQELLRYAGLSLLPFAAIVGYMASRKPLSRHGVVALIAANGAWVAASLLLLVSGRIDPNGLGIAFILAQAVAVAALADVEYFGLRRAFVKA